MLNVKVLRRTKKSEQNKRDSCVNLYSRLAKRHNFGIMVTVSEDLKKNIADTHQVSEVLSSITDNNSKADVLYQKRLKQWTDKPQINVDNINDMLLRCEQFYNVFLHKLPKKIKEEIINAKKKQHKINK